MTLYNFICMTSYASFGVLHRLTSQYLVCYSNKNKMIIHYGYFLIKKTQKTELDDGRSGNEEMIAVQNNKNRCHRFFLFPLDVELCIINSLY